MYQAAAISELAPSLAYLLPDTRYFEMDSKRAGTRFSAWITPPANYDEDQTKAYPVVYQVDGNLFFPATAPFHQALPRDGISPIRPFILVSISYAAQESQDWQWLRVRDLVPPGEPVPEAMYQALEYSEQAGLVTAEKAERYRAMFAAPAADKFLAFIEEELHPALAGIFRIDEAEAGLWGDSYGGLFAVYAAINRSKLFKRIGAGSPGIIDGSQIFCAYREAVASRNDYSGRRLHVTLASLELTQPTIYQSIVARGTAALLAETTLRPLPGLQVSTEIIPLETHLTAGVPAWFSFLRACYGMVPAA
ncbi:alpha/beta hydrolase [Novosphingobium sp. P6W]|uniref:alpha/beta hydrolase n=1 Tax=Novosphingobium sp. P6W TaxID=1609758 RepID=UPI000B22E3FA|nr:alpha/beta hydrolase-fold protein [Novosphingobium sp. P6W]